MSNVDDVTSITPTTNLISIASYENINQNFDNRNSNNNYYRGGGSGNRAKEMEEQGYDNNNCYHVYCHLCEKVGHSTYQCFQLPNHTS